MLFCYLYVRQTHTKRTALYNQLGHPVLIDPLGPHSATPPSPV